MLAKNLPLGITFFTENSSRDSLCLNWMRAGKTSLAQSNFCNFGCRSLRRSFFLAIFFFFLRFSSKIKISSRVRSAHMRCRTQQLLYELHDVRLSTPPLWEKFFSRRIKFWMFSILMIRGLAVSWAEQLWRVIWGNFAMFCTLLVTNFSSFSLKSFSRIMNEESS